MRKTILTVLAVLFLLPGCAEWREQPRSRDIQPEAPASGQAEPAAPSREMVRQEVETVLRENPKLLLDVLAEHKVELFDIVNAGVQAKREQEQKLQLAQELANPKEPAVNPERPRIGPENAPFLVVEYSDFLCPYCGRGAQTVKQFQANHPDEVAVYFKHLPLQESSLTPALYFEAIALQNEELAWKFHDLAFQHAREIAEGGEAYVQQLVGQLEGELDQKRLAEDVQSEKVLERIARDAEEADKFSIQGTPSFLLDGVSIHGAQPLEHFEMVLEAVKARKAN
ncbi:MAG: thioredoxin domain-containing protein [Desulfovibrionaceae bacterium]